jgi:hypothetical protein
MPTNRATPKADPPDSLEGAKHASSRKFGERNLEGLADTPEDRLLDELGRNNEMIARFRLIYSLCGMVLGLVCILGGIVLFLRGVTGATSWTAKLLGAESSMTDAAPGAILFIVGLLLVVATRFRHRTIGSQPPYYDNR